MRRDAPAMAKGALLGAFNPAVLPDCDNSLNYEGLWFDHRTENGYEEGCTRGAKQSKPGLYLRGPGFFTWGLFYYALLHLYPQKRRIRHISKPPRAGC